MSSPEAIVKLTGPESWKEWNLRFTKMAQDNRLWKLIDLKSASRGDFKERPVEPRFADYPKRLDTPASDIRASSTTRSSTPGLIDTEGTPRNLSQMTTAGKKQYRRDNQQLCNWIQKSVDTHKSTRVRMLVKDFRERPCKNNNPKPRTITKGAFITFARHTSDDESNTSSQSKQRSPPPRRSKSRSPTLRSSSKRRFTGGSISGCSSCDNPHCLEEYWAARPVIRSKNRFT
ncbi:hypothetical protein P885DRAFT_64194 [Corynascus similis CBS 632.67]